MTVHLKIDRLVLDGLDPHQADAAGIQQAMQARMIELFTRGPSRQHSTGSGSIGARVADSIHAAIPPTARSRP